MSDESKHVTTVPDPPADGGLRCPHCDYNLTGLPEARCPECGEVFDWEQVRRAADNPPRIYFERVRGWRKVPGFFVTWATVLFAPWIFARQAVARVSTAHALVFGGVCFAGTMSALVWGADVGFMATWLTTAAIYIPLQALLLTILDFPGWRRPLAAFRFWLLIGCYTSAIMLTEIIAGPPEIMLSSVPRLWRNGPWSLVSDWRGAVYCGQMGLWTIGLVCCCGARLRRKRRSFAAVLVVALLAAAGVVLLYAAIVEYVGVQWVSDWYAVRRF